MAGALKVSWGQGTLESSGLPVPLYPDFNHGRHRVSQGAGRNPADHPLGSGLHFPTVFVSIQCWDLRKVLTSTPSVIPPPPLQKFPHHSLPATWPVKIRFRFFKFECWSLKTQQYLSMDLNWNRASGSTLTPSESGLLSLRFDHRVISLGRHGQA